MPAELANKRAFDFMLALMDDGKEKPRSLDDPKERKHTADPRVANFALNYLDAFGYLKDALGQWQDISLGDVAGAIGQFQAMFGLKKTRNLTVQTVRAMEAPRCGCPDIVRARHTCYKKMRDLTRASLPRWQKTAITYRIDSTVPGVSAADFQVNVQKAFNAWSVYSPIDVTPVSGGQTPDIVITTGRGAQSNFDGPGGTLAWAYLPTGTDQQLMMKFDLDETWITDPQQRGIVLLNVATHEFGHLLGLDHSKVQGALMAPYYNVAISTPQANDDVPRLQARYGVRNTPPVVPPTFPPVGATVQVTGAATVIVNGRQVS